MNCSHTRTHHYITTHTDACSQLVRHAPPSLFLTVRLALTSRSSCPVARTTGRFIPPFICAALATLDSMSVMKCCVKMIMAQPLAGPFVDAASIGGERPLDFKEVMRRLESNSYTKVGDIFTDIDSIWAFWDTHYAQKSSTSAKQQHHIVLSLRQLWVNITEPITNSINPDKFTPSVLTLPHPK
eukprot:GDKI01032044.1.p1 GENE.GDKI01032044.1~~GDKI01032044.1.p1  ORF type:complete len:198 (+),score=33.13 GDKI01032044.1:45-596(+)